MIRTFWGAYSTRLIAFSVVSALSAGAGLFYTLALIRSGLLVGYLELLLVVFDVPISVFAFREGTAESIGQGAAIQLLALSSAGILFVFVRTAVGAVRSTSPPDSDSGFSHTVGGGTRATVAGLVVIGIPFVTVVIAVTCVLALGMYAMGEIDAGVTQQVVLQSIVVIPMLTFCEIAITRMTT